LLALTLPPLVEPPPLRLHILMETWCHSNVIHTYMESLVKHGLLPSRTKALEWIIPSDEEVSVLSDGYVVSFIPFHEHGLIAPPHRFL
jgi:hypothetical protein